MNMKKLNLLFTLILAMLILVSCGDDDGASISLDTGNEVSFDLFDVAGGGTLGTATFAELSNGSTRITTSALANI